MNSALPENLQVAWISGMPRSGTTWLSQILASSPDVRLKFCPLFSYEFKNSLNENSTSEEWKDLFEKVYQTKSEFLDQEHLRKHGLIPSFRFKNEKPCHLVIKSNRFHNLTPIILEKSKLVRFIFVVRHPCATLFSWLSNPSEFPKGAEPMNQWRSGKCRKTGPGEFWGFEDWKKVTTQALMLKEHHPKRFKILRYEDLVLQTQELTRDIFKFLSISCEKQTMDFVALSKSKHDERKHSVFKKSSQITRWEECLDPQIVSECLSEVRGTELEQFIQS